MLIAHQRGKAVKELDRIASDLVNRFAQQRESVPVIKGKFTRARIEDGTQVKGNRPSYQTGGNFGGGA